MYTEDEARTKWCPHVRYADDEGSPAANTWGDRPQNFANACIGSTCMAWRWAPLSSADENSIRGRARDMSREMAEKWFQKHRKGYCGLSGSTPDAGAGS